MRTKKIGTDLLGKSRKQSVSGKSVVRIEHGGRTGEFWEVPEPK